MPPLAVRAWKTKAMCQRPIDHKTRTRTLSLQLTLLCIHLFCKRFRWLLRKRNWNSKIQNQKMPVSEWLLSSRGLQEGTQGYACQNAKYVSYYNTHSSEMCVDNEKWAAGNAEWKSGKRPTQGAQAATKSLRIRCLQDNRFMGCLYNFKILTSNTRINC